jgi:hypothetical protein
MLGGFNRQVKSSKIRDTPRFIIQKMVIDYKQAHKIPFVWWLKTIFDHPENHQNPQTN